jgi:chromosome segregation ATPase
VRRALVALATICFTLSACGGSDEDTSDLSTKTVALLTAATQTANLSARLAALADALGAVDQAGKAEQIELRLTEARANAQRTAERVASTPTARLLRDAAEANADAAHELEETAGELAAAISTRQREREPSDEARAELATTSREVKRFKVRVTAAGEDLAAAVQQLDRALGGLADDPALTHEARKRLSSVRKRLTKLRNDATQAILSLQRGLVTEASLLASRSEELTPEPPDVILDCASTIETASDVSVRNMSCEEADGFILQAIPSLAPSFSVGEFSCTILGDYGPAQGPILGAEDIRCESGDRAFRFGFAD